MCAYIGVSVVSLSLFPFFSLFPSRSLSHTLSSSHPIPFPTHSSPLPSPLPPSPPPTLASLLSHVNQITPVLTYPLSTQVTNPTSSVVPYLVISSTPMLPTGEGQCKDCLQGTFDPNSLPYPYCALGFNMNSGVCLPGGCYSSCGAVRGMHSFFHAINRVVRVLPDVADMTISIYSSLSFGTTSLPYVFRLKPDKCVTMPEDVVTNMRSMGILYRALGTNMQCSAQVYYDLPNCAGSPLKSDMPAGNDLFVVPIP
ncbi:unnamed protein product [Closterium sp. NIES-54]